ncbi:hypothetical protein C7S16_5002 [Burkholderia thailandensis]|uniref:Uncharacterized protein n=1 Tax=Burkholderia thailandensis TaxID=57975 RepID=A0AAW9CRC9_BURTH|nr:hypothetical protein [Burkholderia thailandensis]MDW9252396.1 hypothetical protein [Burkholderia thailandensis]
MRTGSIVVIDARRTPPPRQPHYTASPRRESRIGEPFGEDRAETDVEYEV